MRSLATMVAVVATALAGCTGDLRALAPAVPRETNDASPIVSSTADAGTPHFIPDIQNDLDNVGNVLLNGGYCANTTGCHQSPQTAELPTLFYKPTTTEQQKANWMQFMMQCDSSNPTMSIALTNPSDPGSGHPGGQYFAPNGAVYNRWVAWIESGEPF